MNIDAEMKRMNNMWKKCNINALNIFVELEWPRRVFTRYPNKEL